MSRIGERIVLDIEGVEIVVERLEDGTFRKPPYLKGAEREIVGYKQGVGGENLNDIVNEADTIRDTTEEGGKGVGAYGTGAKQVAVTLPVTAAATPEAKQFEGWGTALKPAWEPFVVGRKPL